MEISKPQDFPGKSFDRLTPVEQKQFVADAITERDKFVAWSEEQLRDSKVSQSFGKKFMETVKNAPSKKLLFGSIAAVGLANIGISIAALYAGLSDIGKLWDRTLVAPELEEIVFRTRHIPKFISMIGNHIGIPVRPDTARVANSAIFTAAHIPIQLKFLKEREGKIDKRLAFSMATKFTQSSFYTKVAEEHGLAASAAAHIVHNACVLGLSYIHKMLPPNADMTKLMNATLIASQVGIGILGVKEIFDDKYINDLLQKIRSVDPHNPVLPEETQKVAMKLLKYPSTDGYKFQAGVELGYVNAALHMPDMLKDMMTPDEYARTQVHKIVTSSWKDSKTLPYRLEKANTYISKQIAARKI